MLDVNDSNDNSQTEIELPWKKRVWTYSRNLTETNTNPTYAKNDLGEMNQVWDNIE